MTLPDFIYGVTPGDVIYDIESFPNTFTFTAIHAVTLQVWYFEISFRRNDHLALCRFLEVLRDQGCRMVGFNNLTYDYPVIHLIYKLRQAGCDAGTIYEKSMSIINTPWSNRFAHMIWDSDTIVPQIDLIKMFIDDGTTSLKILECHMRRDRVEETPIPFGTVLNYDQVDEVAGYNLEDDWATLDFYNRLQVQIKLREELSAKFDTNMLNCSDVKIGEKILVHEIEKRGVDCHVYVNGKKEKKQTKRESINLAEVIFPYVKFEQPEFQRIKEFLQAQTITETKGVFNDLIATVDGIEYKIGTGGLHASVDSQIVCSNDTHILVDIDVASFYPNLAIQNKLYPAHLGVEYCEAYLDVYHIRQTYPKKTPLNESFKLALNGAYGGSNHEHSPFLDAFYTMSITINGQLLLCMLAEQMLKVPGLKMIQGNTDGITYLCPREYLEHTRQVCEWWEELTHLELEEALYSRMFIRDVNNYIGEYEGGGLKRIGAYAHVTAAEDPGTRELPWHKDWSARVVPLAAEAALVRGENIRDFIINYKDVYDFMLRTKVPKNSILDWGGDKVPNVVRYYISTEGKFLEKVMPAAGPVGAYKRANKLTDHYYSQILKEVGDQWDERIHTKNKSTYDIRRSGLCAGWQVQLCNNLGQAEWAQSNYTPDDLDYEWYIEQAEKLVDPLTGW